MATVQTPVLGIDLGTTNSCVAVVHNGHVEVIANDMGNRITPSCVAFTRRERLIGIELWPFNVVESSGDPRFRVEYKKETKDFSPEEISAMILGKMKAIAETYIGSPVKDAVVTVPAYFNDSQRQATMDTGRIAGLNIVSLLNKPTAAAIAYGFNQKKDMRQNVLVFDFGGGTFDVAILSLAENNCEVIATSGDTFLGGSDIDERLIKHFMKKIKDESRKDISKDSKALTKLRNACERAKRNVPSATHSPVLVEGLVDGIDFQSTLSQARLYKLCSDIFDKTIDLVEEVLQSSKMVVGDIDEIVLAGGSTRIPKIQELLQKKFNNKKLNKKIHPDEAVAYGAALYAASRSDDKTIENITLVDNGILTVTAEDAATDSNEEIVIRCNKGRLPKKEVERMIIEAKELEKCDKNMKKLRASRHELEILCIELMDIISEQRNNNLLEKEDFVSFLGVCTDTEEWLDENEQAAEEEYRSRHSALLKIKERVL
ncbi:hypothetical protein HAZT_HAZT008188 [Hyalella azteca]|uniref:Uncharacterized protein n=1 Tax=Hyalella azteca TaxID=294128 RepID=A0A6A0H1W6_HYAAZ|nr:hypothetical protein HAZT_HAZT008188 [Hyalella azteca]